MRLDFARLNHILIPKTKEGRDRFRTTRAGRLAIAVFGTFWGSLTDEGRTLATLTLIAGAFGADVQRTTAYVFFATLAGLLFGSLACARALILRDVVLSIDAPKRVTVGENATFTAIVKHRADSREATAPLRVRGPFLPWDGTWIERAPDEMTLAPGATGRAVLVAKFIERGVHHLDSFSVAAVAPLGLACGPRIDSDATKIHVVPRIANVARLPSAVATRHQPGGVALASKSGESMDLAGVRPYRPGDPVRDLHARSWARTGIPVVREYVQEYFTRVGVVLDTDTDDADRLEAAIELAAGVVANLSRGEALVDVLVVGDRVHELTLGRSLGFLDQALDLLATVTRGPSTDLAKRLEPHLEKLSSVIVIAVKKDGDRQMVERQIRDRGVACNTIVLDEDLIRAIAKREALAW